MSSVHLRFRRSFYLRHGFVGGLLGFFCVVMVLTLKQAGMPRFLLPVLFLSPWLFLVRREYFLAAREMDETGVTRRDGRRFPWVDLTEVREVRMHLHPGQPGPLNHVDLHFAGGKVRILLMVLENGWEGVGYAKKKAAARLADLRERICFLIAREARRGPAAGQLNELRGTICRLIAGEAGRRAASGTERVWPELEAPESGERQVPPAWPERREW